MIAELLPASTTDMSTTLKSLLEPWVDVPDSLDRTVRGIQIDSRRVSAGDVFIAVAGDVTHGVDYIDSAVESGASAILLDAGDPRCTTALRIERSVPAIAVPNLVQCAGAIVGRFYHDPSRDLQVVGVTGTDGKSSLCHLLGQALNENRNNCGVIGTLGIGFSNDLSDSGLTTPDSVTIQKALARFRDKGANYAAMEVSSHALAQYRANGVAFDVAVLTNLGRDHLDYHGDMQSYRSAKESLFYQPELRAAVVNSDDEFGNSLMGRLTDLELITYGSAPQSGQHVRYLNVAHDSNRLSFELEFAEQLYAISSGLIGHFNVANLTAVFAVLVALGLSPELAATSIGQLEPVPGRMEVVRLTNGATVIVDYAHNPHALESALTSVSKHVDGKLAVVFGCGGDRDKGKRSLMAQVAERFADHCVVTDDNPRNEDGDEIVKQIVSGFIDPQKVIVERDRRQAIRTTIAAANTGDVVLIAGKGHEDYQLIGDQRLSFSDSQVVREIAAELGA